MPDTWGIPGPTFLFYYISAMVAIAVLAAIHRKILFRGPRGARVDQLGPQQLAYLNGGDRLSVYASMGGLRAAGAIGIDTGRRLVATGHLPAGATPLDTAIHHAASRGESSRKLMTDQWVRTALDGQRADLEAQGLAVGLGRRREIRIWAWAASALFVLALSRLVAGAANFRPVGFLILALVAALVVVVLTWRVTGHATDAALRGMADLRRRNEHLSPGKSPAYATYGAAGAAMGVALFGGAALYSMDPAFAAEAEVQRLAASGGSSGGWSSSGTTTSCSSGSSSCSSGGSSCGGGGGGCGG